MIDFGEISIFFGFQRPADPGSPAAPPHGPGTARRARWRSFRAPPYYSCKFFARRSDLRVAAMERRGAAVGCALGSRQNEISHDLG